MARLFSHLFILISSIFFSLANATEEQLQQEESLEEAPSWLDSSLDFIASESYGLVGNINFLFENGDPQNDMGAMSVALGSFWTSGKYIKQWDLQFYAKDNKEDEVRTGEATRFIQSESITYNIGRYGYWYVANGYAMVGTGITRRREVRAECVSQEASNEFSESDCDTSWFFGYGELKERKTKTQYLPHVRLSAGVGGKFFIEGMGFNTYVQVDPVHVQAGIGLYVMLGKLWIL